MEKIERKKQSFRQSANIKEFLMRNLEELPWISSSCLQSLPLPLAKFQLFNPLLVSLKWLFQVPLIMPDSSVTQFSSISVTKLDDPVIRALTWGLRKPSSCFHCATSFLCESHWAVLSQGVGPEGAEECSAFVLNLRIDHLTWVPTSTWHSGAFFVVFKYF